MNSGYFAAWGGAASVSDQQQAVACSHFGSPADAAAAAISTNISTSNGQQQLVQQRQQAGTTNASWAAPDLIYDHASLLDCARCINQGQLNRYMGGGSGQVGQGNMSLLDAELMQELQYNMEDEEDMSLGMEMKMMKKRKLTCEQARQLEASFEADKKLEAEKKQRLAEQLGLQPRQVAVWFQNRRARSKTKQLEMDFLALKAEYDRVLAQRRSLQAEIARLSVQLQARSSETKNNTCSQDSTSSTNSNNGDVVSKSATLWINKNASHLVVDREGFTTNFSQVNMEGVNGKDSGGNPRAQDSSKSPNLQSYDWDSYDNGLWFFD